VRRKSKIDIRGGKRKYNLNLNRFNRKAQGKKAVYT
jgi:hypothetical protein